MPEEQPMDAQPTELRARLNWRSVDDVPFHVASQFMLQFFDEAYLLSFGQVRPPALLEATPEEFAAIKEIPVQVLGSVSLTPERANALRLLLRRQLARFSPELLAESSVEAEAE